MLCYYFCLQLLLLGVVEVLLAVCLHGGTDCCSAHSFFTKNLKSGAYRRMFTIVQNQLLLILFKTSETMEIL